MTLSLFDVGDKQVIDVYVVFSNRPNDTSWWWRRLKDGYRHVEIWKPVGFGVWLRIDPCLEYMDFQAYVDPPWVVISPAMKPKIARVQRTVPNNKVRDPFAVGPVTCVELAKALLGIRSFFIRTPYQLFKALRRQGHE